MCEVFIILELLRTEPILVSTTRALGNEPQIVVFEDWHEDLQSLEYKV